MVYESTAFSNSNQEDIDLSNNTQMLILKANEVIFANNFEQASTSLVKTSSQHHLYDFSQQITTLGLIPQVIVQAQDLDGQINLMVHIRKVNQRLQTRLSTKVGDLWKTNPWQVLNDPDLVRLIW